MVLNCKGLSCFPVCLCLTLISLHFPLSPLEILNVLSVLFVSRGHGRAASLGTVAVSMGLGAGNQRKRDRECVSTEGSGNAFLFGPDSTDMMS